MALMPTKKKGLFDLPLELRQQIYDEILPKDRMFTIAPDGCWPGAERSEDLKAASRTCPRLSKELRTYAGKKVTGLRILLSSKADFTSTAFTDIRFDKFSDLELIIDYPETLWDQDSTKALRDSIIQFVDATRKYDGLRNVNIRFREDVRGVNRGWDWAW